MNIIVEISREFKDDLLNFHYQNSEYTEIVSSKNFEGIETIKIIIEVTVAFGPSIIEFLMEKRKENKIKKIQVNGTEYEYETIEELSKILKFSNKKNKKIEKKQ